MALNTASNNTAIDYETLSKNNTGAYNTAAGTLALSSNQNGSYNTAAGAEALASNQSGGVNAATAYSALQANMTGFYNVAVGGFALGTNIGGSYNVATGANALYYNKGSNNTATGHQALQNNNSGANNVAMGYQAGNNLTTGSNNIIIGAGVLGTTADANVTRIGKTTQKKVFVGGIRGIKTAKSDAIPVVIDSAWQLGTASSSERFKKDIEPMEKSSEAILGLKPVRFHYKEDSTATSQFGLIAEQVAKVDPDLVVRDENGEIYTVRYDAVNAMLLNEFLKQHRKVQENEGTIAQQKLANAKQDAAINQLYSRLVQQHDEFQTIVGQQQNELKRLATVVKDEAAQIQKVSGQLEINKPSSKLVLNHQ